MASCVCGRSLIAPLLKFLMILPACCWIVPFSHIVCSRGTVFVTGCSGNPDAKRLYDDLLSNYNKLVRPVVNVTDALTVKIKLKLSQLIDVVSDVFCT